MRENEGIGETITYWHFIHFTLDSLHLVTTKLESLGTIDYIHKFLNTLESYTDV